MSFDIAGALGVGYTPAEIVKHFQDNPADMAGFDVGGALKAGYSPEEIVDHLNPRASHNWQGVPVLGPLQRGASHLSGELANLADDLGANGVGGYLRGSTTQAPLKAETSGGKLSEDLREGRILSALSNVPSAALEQLVPVAGGAGASMLSGGSVPVTLAAGGVIGALSQGDSIARARATNNGRAEPSTSDLALGLAGGAGVGAVGTVGLGGLGKGATAALGATMRHGLADAAQPEMAALAGSAGTDQGVQHASAADMGAAALTGLATRAGIGAPDLARGAVEAVQARTPAGREASARERWEALGSDGQDIARQQAAAIDAVRQVQRDAVSTQPVSDAVAANTAADMRASQVTRLADTLDRQGVLPDNGKQVIRDAIQAAQDPATALTSGHLDGVRGLGIDAETTGRITDTLHQVNLLSAPDFTTAPTGPVEGLMRAAGPGVVGAVLGSLGGPKGTMAGAVAGHMLRPAGADSLGVLGKVIDGMVGTATPSAITTARNAAKMMEAAGVPVPDTAAGLQQATLQARSAIEAQSRLMGLQDAQDRAAADKFKIDYGDATKMNRDFDATKAAEARATYADALAMDRQRTQDQNFQRSQEVGDAQAMDRQRTQQQSFDRAQEVGDALAINAQRDRGLNLNEREGGKVAMMALRAQRSEGTTTPPKDTSSPLADPMTVATNRAAARRASEVPEVAQPVPGMDGLSRKAVLQGELLPEWQYGVGEALKQALHTAGMPKNLNTAQEVAAAVKALVEREAFTPEFARALMGHGGRIVRGVYNLIRNEMLLNHGIDMRTIEAQRTVDGELPQ